MSALLKAGFDPTQFLASAGMGRKIVRLEAKDAFFSQATRRMRSSTFKKEGPS